MLIGHDVDEMLLQFLPSFLRWHNLEYGSCLEMEDMDDFDMSNRLDCNREECARRIFEFYDHPMMENLIPVPGAVDALSYLGLKHENIAITSRTKSLREITQRSIDKYFYDSIKGLYLTGEWIGNGGKTKGEVCLDLGVDVLVDDRPKYCHEAVDVGIDAILFNYKGKYGYGEPYAVREGLYHAQDFDEVIGIIEDLDS